MRLRDDFRAPDEHETEARAWDVTRAAYREREPQPIARRRTGPVAAALVVVAIAAGAATQPGRAVLGSLRKAVGVEHAAPALFRLPAPGRLLVRSDAGPWIVQRDGSKRLLDGWTDASWSPFGHYVVATRANEVAALDLDGHVRWTLARPAVRLAAWGGGRLDTRIAYLTTSRLHAVGGDGKGDVDAGGLPAAAPVRPAWRPGPRFVVAYADTRGHVRAVPVDAGGGWRSPVIPGLRRLEWSTDGRRLLAIGRDKLVVLDASGRVLTERAQRVVASALRPGTHEVAFLRTRAGTSEAVVGNRVVFRGTGAFSGMAFSPDGHWLLVAWPTADQWVFVHLDAQRQIVAVAGVTGQFGGGAFPQPEGWCCSAR